MPALLPARKRSDPAEFGGAPLLGVRGCCVIGHGRSGAQAIRNGIRAAAEFYTSGVNAAIDVDAQALGPRGRPPGHEGRLRLPRAGLAEGRHGPGAGADVSREPRGVRRGRRSPGRCRFRACASTGPKIELQLTANTQPAILATSIAALRPLVTRGVRPSFVAGHSLGEYSALVAAGTLSPRRRRAHGAPARPVHAGGGPAGGGRDGRDPRPRPAGHRAGLPRCGRGRGRESRPT